jgi:hypothetical protein
MAYNPITDFLALLRNTNNGMRTERTPGLDFVVAALARAGLFSLSIGQTPPTSNQATTVWFLPSSPTWVAEGAVFLWNALTGAYAPATPALWNALLSSNGYLFQSVTGATGVINAGVTVLAVQRAAPAATSLALPNLQSQWLTGRDLNIVDWSTAVTNHIITLTTPDGTTIMRNSTFELVSNAAQLTGLRLKPVPDLNGWIIAP